MDFSRIAIVNRGEPAVRAIHAIRELSFELGVDLRSIALYTDPDQRAMFVREADERYSLGEPTFIDPRDDEVKSSYLDFGRLEEALKRTEADAAWVGWGFVAEQAEFAELCQRLGVRFIGPTPEAMRRAGDKIAAKHIAEAAGVAVTPWSGGSVRSMDHALREAARLGYPVMVKAAAGGGGRGIRVVEHEANLEAALRSARSEALKAFGDDTVFLEQIMAASRHIEVQVIADHYGTVWPVGVRDCSVQRRHQKLIEEAPSPVLTAEQDAEIRATAARLATAFGYTNAGTVEFLYDPVDARFVFMEVNARLQVEHPVTEVTTGFDLVKQQLRVAAGERLEGQPPLTVGHAVEARLNAEDSDRGFAPAPGEIELLRFPAGPGLRIDTGVEEGDHIAAEFDSMIAKVIAHGRDRGEAIARLWRALAQASVLVRGGTSNRAFLQHLVSHPEFRSGQVDVGWTDRLISRGEHHPGTHAEIALCEAAIRAYELGAAYDRREFLATAARGRPDVGLEIGRDVELTYLAEGYRLRVLRRGPQIYRILVDGCTVDVEVAEASDHQRRLTVGDRTYRVLSIEQPAASLVEVDGVPHRIGRGDRGVVRAPAPCVVVSVLAEPGEVVEAGTPLVVLEAMKMETVVHAEVRGRIREILAHSNEQVGAGAPLVVVEPIEAEHPPADAPRADFSRLVPPDGRASVDHYGCAHGLEELRYMLLGFDVTPPRTRPDGMGVPCGGALLGAEERRRREDEILGVFVDVAALFRRLPADDDADFGRESSAEYLFTYLRDLSRAGRGLPEGFMTQLRRTLQHYGVTSLEPSAQLEQALYDIARSQRRMDEQIGPVVALLEKRLDEADRYRDDAWRSLLTRLADETRQRWPAVHDLANEVRYRTFDQVFLQEVRSRAYAEAADHVRALAEDPTGSQRAEHIGALVACSQPLKTVLSAWYASAAPALRGDLLEVMTRRYYRLGTIHDLETFTTDGHVVCLASCTLDDSPLHVLSTHVNADDLEGAAKALGSLIGSFDDRLDVLVDFYAWREEPLADRAAFVETARPMLDETLPDEARQVVIALSSRSSGPGMSGVDHFTFRRGDHGYEEDPVYRALHPMMGKRLELWRLQNFAIEALPSVEDVYVFRGRAYSNERDERLFVLAEVRDMTAVRDSSGLVLQLPELERMYMEALNAIRRVQSRLPAHRRLEWNRVLLHVWPSIKLSSGEIDSLVQRLAPAVEGLGLEKVAVLVRMPLGVDQELRRVVLEISNPDGTSVVAKVRKPNDVPFEPLTAYTQKVVQLRRRGLMYPYELVRVLAPTESSSRSGIPSGSFVEHDLDGDRLVPVDRAPGLNQANVVVGLISTVTDRYPEGMQRVILLGDPSRGMGSLAEPECRRIIAAIDRAQELCVPLEWFAVSAGALIAMDSGTENMDWIARVLRHIVEFTQAGGELNVVVTGINVGAQPYWNAEATMLMHTRGILVMTPESAMVLTGKQALDYSGGVSAEDNQGIGGYERIMGRNGQAQYLARDLTDACRILLRHYDHAYVAPGERFSRRARTNDRVDRDVCSSPHGGDFATVGEVFSEVTNPGRKKPFDIRRVMAAVIDQDHPPLERWFGMQEAEVAVVWEAHLGGHPVCLLGLESMPLARRGLVPADGPQTWTSGTLFPLSSKKVARAINSASGSRPVVVLANLSGFDGSPESMRRLQLEYGAEIGRAVVNFEGPIVFCVVSRYHGGAFVVFSKALADNLEVAALEGAHASVIGGAPAAAVVFAREVDRRTLADQRAVALREQMNDAQGATLAELRSGYERLVEDLRSEKLGEVAAEFDAVHDVERARRMGSVDRIIPPSQLRPYLVDAVERGMQHELERSDGDRRSSRVR
jgi:acetyl/propionyl-CoA carboxylase alpha subunit/acetyl-CoA carboxylase carboxyltransferase component